MEQTSRSKWFAKLRERRTNRLISKWGVPRWMFDGGLMIPILVFIALFLVPNSPASASESLFGLSVPEMTIIGEAANQGMTGMVAIGEVIRTRAKERHLTPEAVCLQPKQFSAWNQGSERLEAFIRKNQGIIGQAKTAWSGSAYSNLTNGSNLYHATSVSPSWSRSPKVKFICQIGQHRFYKESK